MATHVRLRHKPTGQVTSMYSVDAREALHGKHGDEWELVGGEVPPPKSEPGTTGTGGPETAGETSRTDEGSGPRTRGGKKREGSFDDEVTPGQPA